MRNVLFITGVLLFVGAGCTNITWTGYYYPDADNIGDESSWIIKSGLESLDECRDWVDSIAFNDTNFDYECGYNCKYNSSYLMEVCERTEQ